MIARRVTLRLRVLTGVVAITLIALAAFDYASVAIMRGYLLRTTGANVQQALVTSDTRLTPLLAWGSVPALGSSKARIVPTVSDYSIAFVPTHGRPVTLQTAVAASAAVDLAVGSTGHGFGSAKGGVISYMTPTSIVVERPVYGGRLVAGTSLEQVNKTLNQVILIVTLGSIAAILGIGCGVFYVLRRGMRPIESMAVQADRISAGDLADRVDARQPGSEVGRLGTALNGMLDRIETFVVEREADQEQMRRFFADASHELRTPLATVRANAELYQQGAVTSKPEVDEVMRRIVSETRRMGQLVDDMLGLARLGQHPEQEREPVDVVDLVSECVDSARASSPERTWRLVVHSQTPVYVEGDAEMLRRAVDNLIANVRTHTPPHTAATIAVGEADGSATIAVLDDGPGVGNDELPRVFDRFYRGSSPVRRPGSGLGLAIVSGIAAAHGGSVRAESNRPHGLRVTLSFPVLRLSMTH